MESLQHKTRSVIVFLLLGGLFLWVAFYLIDTGVRHSDFEQTGKVNKIVNHSIDPGLIVFGSSVSEVGVDPAILQAKTGLTAYNCSINGTRFSQYKGLIDEFTQYSRDNRYTVLVETYFSFEKIDALTMSEYFLSQVSNDHVYAALHEVQPDLVWKSRYVPFYKYTTVSYKYYKNSLLGWKKILRPGTNNDPLSGYAPVDRHWEADADEAIRNTPHFDVQIDSGIVRHYTDCIRALQSKGRKAVLVLTPMFTEMLKRVTDISPVRAELKSIAALTGARFLDFSQSPICDNKDNFYNSNHLNLPGSRIFSSVLGDSLAAMVATDKLAQNK